MTLLKVKFIFLSDTQGICHNWVGKHGCNKINSQFVRCSIHPTCNNNLFWKSGIIWINQYLSGVRYSSFSCQEFCMQLFYLHISSNRNKTNNNDIILFNTHNFNRFKAPLTSTLFVVNSFELCSAQVYRQFIFLQCLLQETLAPVGYTMMERSQDFFILADVAPDCETGIAIIWSMKNKTVFIVLI